MLWMTRGSCSALRPLTHPGPHFSGAQITAEEAARLQSKNRATYIFKQ